MSTAELIPAAAEAEVASVKRPSFWALADDLQAYTETMAMLEEQLAGATGEERPDIEADILEVKATIDALGAALVQKTDSLAGVLRRMKSDVALLKEEKARISARIGAVERAEKWLKEYTAGVLQEHGWKHLKTALNTIALRGNGGLRPLKLDEAVVPGEYWTVDVRLTAEEARCLPPGVRVIGRAIDGAKVRAALEAGVQVPGAELQERGQHIEVR